MENREEKRKTEAITFLERAIEHVKSGSQVWDLLVVDERGAEWRYYVDGKERARRRRQLRKANP